MPYAGTLTKSSEIPPLQQISDVLLKRVGAWREWEYVSFFRPTIQGAPVRDREEGCLHGERKSKPPDGDRSNK
jgi:hypothetical protein